MNIKLYKIQEQEGVKMESNGGISSLGGFAYQIKVFVYYLEQLQEDMEIGYETYEDVAINYNPENKDYIDNKCKNFNSLYKTEQGITAIQVKKTKLNLKDFDQLLYNWLLLEMSDKTISKFILFMDGSYNNSDKIFSQSSKSLFNKIIKSDDDSKSLKSKVKKIVDGDFEKFEKAYNKIKINYEFKPIENIDDELLQIYRKTFLKARISDTTYSIRIQELLSKITSEIMKNVVNGKAYICKYSEFICFVADIIQSITDDETWLNFSIFKSLNRVSLRDIEIATSRQYKQLCNCFRQESKIEEHLIFEQYYNAYKLSSLGNMRKDTIDNIEETTYSNFTDAKEFLFNTDCDKPFLRLDETKKRKNSYTRNEQISYGAAIHLTKEDTEKDILISWKDDEDE